MPFALSPSQRQHGMYSKMQHGMYSKLQHPSWPTSVYARAGGVFEEALAQATYFLEPGSPIAQTVRNADIIDNVWKSGSLSSQASKVPSPESKGWLHFLV